MALADIQQHIKSKADDEITKINTASEETLKALDKEWKTKLTEEKERQLAEINRGAEAKLTQAKFKIREKVNSEKLKARQTQIDQVYQGALKALGDLSDKDYTALMEKLLKPVKGTAGTLLTCEKRVKELETAAKSTGCKADLGSEMVDTAGGFVLRTADADLDYTLETLLDQIKDETLIETNSLLFNA